MLQQNKNFNIRNLIHPKDIPIILIQIGLADGVGDWVHGLEIAKYIKRNFADKYQIVAFAVTHMIPDINGPHQAIISFIKKFSLIDNITQLEINPFFNYLFYDDRKNLEAKYIKFVKDNVKNIFVQINISYIDSCFYIAAKDRDFKIIFMSEYGINSANYYYDKYDINLNMGLGKTEQNFRYHGIRIYTIQGNAEKIYWEKLKIAQSDFYHKILSYINYDYELYYQQRKLLPGDVRIDRAILAFIKINLIRYGDKCDFYLPFYYFKYEKTWGKTNVNLKLPLQQIQKEINNICKEFHIECKYVTPISKLSDAMLDPNKSQIRIFYDFDLNNEVYKGMYLYNRKAGVGISGDDGWSLAISSNNLPFHGKIDNFGVQIRIIENILNMLQDLEIQLGIDLSNLINYLKIQQRSATNCYDYTELEQIFSNFSDLKKLEREYLIFSDYVKKELNIYPKLQDLLLDLENQQSIAIEANSTNLCLKMKP